MSAPKSSYAREEKEISIMADSPSTQTGKIAVFIKDGPKGFIAMQIGHTGRWANIPIKEFAKALGQLKKNGTDGKAS